MLLLAAMPRPSAAVAALTAALLVTAACGRSWPKTTPVMADPVFAARQRPITRLDILPLDLEAWIQPGGKRNADQLRALSEAGLLGAASEELMARGYLVENALGWDGQFVLPDGQSASALSPDELLATIDALSSYGLAAAQTGQLPVPYLPARLGEDTHTDATLYIGGWTFQGSDRSTGDKIAKGILIGIAIVGVVALIAVIAKGGGGDSLGRIGGGVARGAVQVATSVGRAALRAGNATIHLVRGAAEITADVLQGVAEAADAFGRIAPETHLTLLKSNTRPVWSERADVPKKGRSRTYLEMTLVDNHTGLVLWHTRQEFPTHAATEAKAHKIMRTLMASLPPAGPGY